MTDDWWDDTDTRAMCARDPNLEGMRQLVLKLERDAHKRGWDHEDNQHKLFEVMRGEDLVGLRMAGMLQDAFDMRCAQREGNVGFALLDLSRAVEETRREMGTDAASDMYGPELVDAVVYGWGLLSETWMVAQPRDATPEQKAAQSRASQNHELHLHPDRIEGRMIQLVCRDGMHWTVMRERGKPAKAMVQKPESLGTTVGGNVPYGLGRMLNAIVSNPVPVPSRGADFWKRQGGRR